MENKIVYDIGMHNGDDTCYYLSKGYKVISIEASPELAEKSKKRFADEIKKGRLKILNIGIAEREGKMEFYLNKTNSVWNSFDPKIAKRGKQDYEKIYVETKSIDSVIKLYGFPHYMKIDIEGNDIICLDSLQKLQTIPKYISAEVGSQKVLFKLKELGYTRFKLVDQFSLLPLEIPMTKAYRYYRLNKSFSYSMNLFIRILRKLFGKWITRLLLSQRNKILKYNFQFGSSGSFGENLPGQWYTFDEIMEVYCSYRQQHQGSGRDVGFNFWVDIHGTY